MARQASKQLRRAIEHVKRLASGRIRTGTSRLPTISTMAGEADVAVATMWKAVGCCRDQGIVTACQRQGIHAARPNPDARADASTPPAAPDGRSRRWQVLASQIEQDILRGTYAPGTQLPSLKELTQRYGACHRTVRHSLSELARSQKLTRHYRGFRTPRASSRGLRHSVILFAVGDVAGNLDPFTSRTFDLIRGLERGCQSAGINLITSPFDFRSQRFSSLDALAPTLRDPSRLATILGFIILTVGIAGEALEKLCGRLSSLHKPLSLLDETGELRLPAEVLSTGRTRVFSMSNSEAPGEQVGRYALELGHTTVAYLSPRHDSTWSTRRLAGLRSVCAAAGLRDAVHAFTSPADSGVPHASAPPSLSDAMARTLARSVPASTVDRAALERVEQKMTGALGLGAGIIDAHLSTRPLANEALSLPSATAWVAANDEVALECLSFLQQRGRGVPQDISLIGFDDTIEGFSHKLTSYNFNCTAAVNAMLSHVLHPAPSRVPSPAVSPVEIEGFVIARATSARPRRGLPKAGEEAMR